MHSDNSHLEQCNVLLQGEFVALTPTCGVVKKTRLASHNADLSCPLPPLALSSAMWSYDRQKVRGDFGNALNMHTGTLP